MVGYITTEMDSPISIEMVHFQSGKDHMVAINH